MSPFSDRARDFFQVSLLFTRKVNFSNLPQKLEELNISKKMSLKVDRDFPEKLPRSDYKVEMDWPFTIMTIFNYIAGFAGFFVVEKLLFTGLYGIFLITFKFKHDG